MTEDEIESLLLFAKINDFLGDHDAACECFEVCLGLKEKFDGLNESYADTQFLFAELQVKAGNQEKALELFFSSLKIQKVCLGGMHLNIAKVLKEISDVLLSRHKLDEAVDYMRQELEIKEELLGNDCEAVSDCQERIGTANFQRCEYKASVQNLIEALRIRELLQFEDETTSQLLYKIGRSFFMMPDYSRACDYFNKGKW